MTKYKFSYSLQFYQYSVNVCDKYSKFRGDYLFDAKEFFCHIDCDFDIEKYIPKIYSYDVNMTLDIVNEDMLVLLKNTKKLRTLSFGTVSDNIIDTFCRFLKTMNNREITMRESGNGQGGMHDILESLSDNKNITMLTIHYDDKIKNIVSNNKHVTYLKICVDEYYGTSNERDIPAMVFHFRNYESLQHFELSQSDAVWPTELYEIFISDGCIIRYDISTKLNQEDVDCVSNILLQNTITELKIADFSTQCASELIENFRNNTSLKTLSLFNVDEFDAGLLQNIFSILNHNTNIDTLCLLHIGYKTIDTLCLLHIGHKNVIELVADLIKHNHTVKHISIGGKLSDYDLSNLHESLLDNHTVLDITSAYNDAPLDSVTEKYLERNRKYASDAKFVRMKSIMNDSGS